MVFGQLKFVELPVISWVSAASGFRKLMYECMGVYRSRNSVHGGSAGTAPKKVGNIMVQHS